MHESPIRPENKAGQVEFLLRVALLPLHYRELGITQPRLLLGRSQLVDDAR